MSRGICHPGYCYHRNSPFFSSQIIAITTNSSIRVKPRRAIRLTSSRCGRGAPYAALAYWTFVRHSGSNSFS